VVELYCKFGNNPLLLSAYIFLILSKSAFSSFKFFIKRKKTMRYSGTSTLVLLLVMLFPVSLLASGDLERADGFISWASRVSSELDARWNTISGQGSFTATGVEASTGFPVSPAARTKARESSAGKLRTSILVSRNYIRKGNNIPFLPLSTRKRNSPSRGTGSLRSPSSARLHVAYKRLRPVKSFTTEKRFFGGRKGFIRPKLRSNRRISLSRYRSGRNATRPAYRAGRPKRFKSIF